LGLGWYDYGARMYDATIGRFNSVDRFAEKYQWATPYHYTLNNPILFADVNGDSINLAFILIYDRENGTNVAQKIVDDLSLITGLTLNIDRETGMILYEKDKDGNPIVSTEHIEPICECVQKGSETARNDLVNTIDDVDHVNVAISPNGRSQTPRGGNQIFLGIPQIEGFIQNTESGLNNRTMGYGMTLLHEYGHTGPGGSLADPPNPGDTRATGDVVDRVNVYRQELDDNPTTNWSSHQEQFGQRQHYHALPRPGGGGIIKFNVKKINRRGKRKNITKIINF